jgi:hypothetical protein
MRWISKFRAMRGNKMSKGMRKGRNRKKEEKRKVESKRVKQIHQREYKYISGEVLARIQCCDIVWVYNFYRMRGKSSIFRPKSGQLAHQYTL